MSEADEAATRWNFCVKWGAFPALVQYTPQHSEYWSMVININSLNIEMGRGASPDEAVDSAVRSVITTSVDKRK